MLDQRFYWGTIRKAIIAFGNMFNSITIERKDGNGNTISVQRVPLSYSPKQKFLARINQQPTIETNQFQVILPRMGFDIQSFQYDVARKVSPIQNNKAIVDGAPVTSVSRSFVSTPWNMTLSLYVYAKNQEDGLQIIEQILPFFNPDFSITVNELPELGIKRDIKITLDSVNYEDNYEGELAARQSIIWTLDFTMRLNFYGNISNQKIIREAIANAYTSLESETGTKVTASIEATGDVDPASPADPHIFVVNFDDVYES